MCLIGTICDMMSIGSCAGLIGIRKRLMQFIYYDAYLVQTYFINKRGTASPSKSEIVSYT